jgi:hypothetical protein
MSLESRCLFCKVKCIVRIGFCRSRYVPALNSLIYMMSVIECQLDLFCIKQKWNLKVNAEFLFPIFAIKQPQTRLNHISVQHHLIILVFRQHLLTWTSISNQPNIVAIIVSGGQKPNFGPTLAWDQMWIFQLRRTSEKRCAVSRPHHSHALSKHTLKPVTLNHLRRQTPVSW